MAVVSSRNFAMKPLQYSTVTVQYCTVAGFIAKFRASKNVGGIYMLRSEYRRSSLEFAAEKIRRAARDPAPEPASPGAAQQPKPVVVAAPLVVSSSIWLLMASPRRQHAACAMGCSRAAACRQRRARLARRRPPVRESTRGHVRAELRGVGAAPSLRSGGHLL